MNYDYFPISLTILMTKSVEHLNKRDDAKPKAQAKQATNVGYEVSFGHSTSFLIL